MGELICYRIGVLMESAQGKALSFTRALMTLSVAKHWITAARSYGGFGQLQRGNVGVIFC